MLIKKKKRFIILFFIGIPILFQMSGVEELRSAVSAFAMRPGPNLYLENNEMLKHVPKYSLITLSDGREGSYLWIYEGKVHLELKEKGGRTAVSPDQIDQVIFYNINMPVATFGFGVLVGSIVYIATRSTETLRMESREETFFDEDIGEYVTVAISGGFSTVATYYPEKALVSGVFGALAGGLFAHIIEKRSTFTIDNNSWQLSIVDNLQN